ncbi:MAG: HD domain-containing protein [Erysipelotrichia bacterium]|nr:HD domain-containing protein [Erysipelotrichia bacterium]
MIVEFHLSADPITQKELEEMLRYIREKHISLGVIRLNEKGILDRAIREKLVNAAIRPYRRLRLVNQEHAFSYPAVEIDSSEEALVREGQFRLAAKGTAGLLNDAGCYYEEIVDAQCSSHRSAHSRSCAALCRELAEAHGLDGNRAWRMGMLHDITKKKDAEWGRSLLAVYDPEKLPLSPKVWHSFTAPIVLKQDLCLKDCGILHAIYHHTLGDGSSDLDRILYIADKCERTRGYDTEKEIRMACRNLKQGAELVKEEQKTYLREKENLDV